MKTKHAVFPALFTLVAFSGGPVAAETACKGLSESACGEASACSWVKGYTRKDGRTVASYCRIKNKPEEAATKSLLEQAGPKG